MAEYQIQIIRSKRKTIGFSIREAGVLIVRAPMRMSDAAIMKSVEKHEDWIQKHMKMVQERKQSERQYAPYSEEEIRSMANQAAREIPPKVRRYAELIGVTYGRITIRNQRTRWGSCSAKGNLNFNCLLTQVPEEVLDYVIVHELCHRREMNHSEHFWKLVEYYVPDYREKKKWLHEHGGELISRMKKGCL